MNAKMDGRRALRFWATVNQGFFYLMIYQLLSFLDVVGLIVCLALFAIKIYEIYANKRDVFHKICNRSKWKTVLFFTLGGVVLFVDVFNPNRWALVLGLYFGYFLTGAYAENLYNWAMRWDDYTYTTYVVKRRQIFQSNLELDALESLNAKFLNFKLMPAILAAGIVSYLLWISPLFHWIRVFLLMVISNVTLFIANIFLGHIPKVLLERAGQSKLQMDAPADITKSFYKTKEMGDRPEFQSAYEMLAIAVLVLFIVGIVYLLWRSVHKTKGREASESYLSKTFDFVKNWVAPQSEQTCGKATKRHGAPDAILRKKYIQLMKTLKKHGLGIEKTETADQLKDKLSRVYPNQEASIDLITQAYCERRYAERDPCNIDEVLTAFQMLKEAK